MLDSGASSSPALQEDGVKLCSHHNSSHSPANTCQLFPPKSCPHPLPPPPPRCSSTPTATPVYQSTASLLVAAAHLQLVSTLSRVHLRSCFCLLPDCCRYSRTLYPENLDIWPRLSGCSLTCWCFTRFGRSYCFIYLFMYSFIYLLGGHLFSTLHVTSEVFGLPLDLRRCTFCMWQEQRNKAIRSCLVGWNVFTGICMTLLDFNNIYTNCCKKIKYGF